MVQIQNSIKKYTFRSCVPITVFVLPASHLASVNAHLLWFICSSSVYADINTYFFSFLTQKVVCYMYRSGLFSLIVYCGNLSESVHRELPDCISAYCVSVLQCVSQHPLVGHLVCF